MLLPILFEDHALVIVNKPNNMLVHSSYYARNIKSPSLCELLKVQVNQKIYPIHRLDHKTSGIIILAKKPEAANNIQQQFESGSIQKKYMALLRGFSAKTGKIDTPVKNADTGKYKPALTLFKTLESVEVPIAVEPYPQSRYSLVEFEPKTGRMHQLRKHANKISHPIIGDHKYGNRHHNKMFEEELGFPNMFLHAKELTFNHPESKKSIHLAAPFPVFWNRALIQLGFTVPLDNNQNHLG